MDKEILEHLPKSYQRFYSILKEAGIDPKKIKLNSKKEGRNENGKE